MRTCPQLNHPQFDWSIPSWSVISKGKYFWFLDNRLQMDQAPNPSILGCVFIGSSRYHCYTIAIGFIAHYPVFLASNQGWKPSRFVKHGGLKKMPFASIKLPLTCLFSWWAFQLAIFHDTVERVYNPMIFQWWSQWSQWTSFHCDPYETV